MDQVSRWINGIRKLGGGKIPPGKTVYCGEHDDFFNGKSPGEAGSLLA